MLRSNRELAYLNALTLQDPAAPDLVQCLRNKEWIGLDFGPRAVQVRCLRIRQAYHPESPFCCHHAERLELQRWDGAQFVTAQWQLFDASTFGGFWWRRLTSSYLDSYLQTAELHRRFLINSVFTNLDLVFNSENKCFRDMNVLSGAADTKFGVDVAARYYNRPDSGVFGEELLSYMTTNSRPNTPGTIPPPEILKEQEARRVFDILRNSAKPSLTRRAFLDKSLWPTARFNDNAKKALTNSRFSDGVRFFKTENRYGDTPPFFNLRMSSRSSDDCVLPISVASAHLFPKKNCAQQVFCPLLGYNEGTCCPFSVEDRQKTLLIHRVVGVSRPAETTADGKARHGTVLFGIGACCCIHCIFTEQHHVGSWTPYWQSYVLNIVGHPVMHHTHHTPPIRCNKHVGRERTG